MAFGKSIALIPMLVIGSLSWGKTITSKDLFVTDPPPTFHTPKIRMLSLFEVVNHLAYVP
jgi:hypothetical protein